MASPMPRAVPDIPTWATRLVLLLASPKPLATLPRAATTPNCPNPDAKAAKATPTTARSFQRCNRNAARVTVTLPGSVLNAARLVRDAFAEHAR